MKLWKLASITLGMALSFNVNAALMSADWQTSGDNLLTIDSISGLSWLDLSESNGMSYNEVLSQLGEGGIFEGFRYATTNEVIELWSSNFGVDLYVGRSSFESGSIDAGIEVAVSFLGDTIAGHPYFSGTGVTGLTSSISESLGYPYYCGALPEVNCRDVIGAYYDPDFNNAYQTPGHTHEHIDSTDPYFGSYLVKDVAEVPLPAAIWLFGSGLIGLVGLARRKKA